MKTTEIRTLVRELIAEAKKAKGKMVKTSVGDRLKMIDEAGDKAALQAKIAKIDEDIKAAHDIKSAIPVDIKHFVDAEIVGDLMDDLADSIKELEEKKKELEEQMKGMDKPVKEARFKKGTDIGKPGKVLKKVIKKESIHNTAQMGGVTTSKGTAGYINNSEKNVLRHFANQLSVLGNSSATKANGDTTTRIITSA
jgi:outer membrane murein-binding lipoprotein Lpp